MKVLSQISSCLLAFVVLMASMGFTINKHYCGGELRKVTINQKAELCPVCKKLEEEPLCHKKKAAPESCCENQQDKIQTSDYSLVKHVEQHSVADFQFIAFTYVILADIHANDIRPDYSHYQYNPPLIDHDIPVEVQSFLL